jgi:hypothetical protein
VNGQDKSIAAPWTSAHAANRAVMPNRAVMLEISATADR